MVTNGERAAWERDGFFIRRGFASQETARGMLERVVEIDGAHVEAHTWLGQLHFDAGRTEEARAALQRAQALDPFAARPWFLVVLALEIRPAPAERIHWRRFILLINNVYLP